MQKTIIKSIIKSLDRTAVKELVVGVLWFLAQQTENELDDSLVETIAVSLGVDLK